MKNPGLALVAAVLCIPGAIFFFQGIGVLKGSTMTGEGQWTVIGAVMFVVGLGFAVAGLRPSHRAESRDDL